MNSIRMAARKIKQLTLTRPRLHPSQDHYGLVAAPVNEEQRRAATCPLPVALLCAVAALGLLKGIAADSQHQSQQTITEPTYDP